VIGDKPTRNRKSAKKETCEGSRDKESTVNYLDFEMGVIKKEKEHIAA
jgi:hypothetical protein